MNEPRNGDATFRARGLHKNFGGLCAVNNVSLDLHAGEIHAVIGPNGAGKSTLINLLSGDLAVDAGEIRLGATVLTQMPPWRCARAGVGRAFQKTTIFPDASVHENVRLAAQAKSSSPLRMFGGVTADIDQARCVAKALDQAGLAARGQIMADHLSHGEQRQLEIAMVLAGAPRVILLDEPLAGMGSGEARNIIELVRSLKYDHVVLLVEHDMDAVFELADRLTVMVDGSVIASGAPDDVRKDDGVQAAYLGEAESAS